MVVKTNVDISMPDEYPSKCSRIQSKEIDCDPESCKQICEFPINKQDEIQRAYLKEGPYQPKNIDYPYNDDTHRHRFQPSNQLPHVQIPGYAPGCTRHICQVTHRLMGPTHCGARQSMRDPAYMPSITYNFQQHGAVIYNREIAQMDNKL